MHFIDGMIVRQERFALQSHCQPPLKHSQIGAYIDLNTPHLSHQAIDTALQSGLDLADDPAWLPCASSPI